MEIIANISSELRHGIAGKSWWHWVLVIGSMLGTLVGGSAATILGRYYFVHGGKDRWVYTWLQATGWPVIALPILAALHLRRETSSKRAHGEAENAVDCLYNRRRLALSSFIIGLLMGLDNWLYAWGTSYLPVSTSTLLFATQLAFNTVFSYFLFRRRLTVYVINSVVIITTSAILLGLQSSSDRPPGTTPLQYRLGFGATIGASALYGLILPLTELAYILIGGISPSTRLRVVTHLQWGNSLAATLFALVGMAASGSFRAIRREYHTFDVGSAAYVWTLVSSALLWQVFYFGANGMILLTSSLLSSVFMTATLPAVPIVAIFVFHDSFTAIKGISAFLGIWGFVSYTMDGLMQDSNARCHHTCRAFQTELESADQMLQMTPS